jgi:hypothetical protein
MFNLDIFKKEKEEEISLQECLKRFEGVIDSDDELNHGYRKIILHLLDRIEKLEKVQK